MAYVRFAVYDESGASSTNRLLGQRILPVSHMQSGYKHLVLRSQHNKPLGPTTLFIHVDVQDYVSDAHRDLVDALQNPIEAVSRQRREEIIRDESVDAMTKEEKNLRMLKALWPDEGGGEESSEKSEAEPAVGVSTPVEDEVNKGIFGCRDAELAHVKPSLAPVRPI